MIEFPTLRTARLLLRRPEVSDAPSMFANYTQDPEVTRYLTWPPHASLELTETIVGRIIGGIDLASKLPWAIVRQSDNAMIGMIELRIDRFKAEVGYALSRSAWGLGLMTEALQAVVDYGFSRPEIYRIGAVCDVDNAGSARVMEKVGMRFEGTLRRYSIHPNAGPEPRDCHCYAIVRGED